MDNIEILKKYYKQVCTPLVFVGVNKLLNSKVYLYDFRDDIELKNFKKVFQEYMAMYVLNEDIINYYEFNDVEKISEQLCEIFKENYKVLTPKRKATSSGIFGELFNDYYLKNILDNELLLTYLSKKAYADNTEMKGIDVVCVENKEDGLEIILSEAKFVTDAISAKNELKSDISGEKNHLNQTTINNYMYFVLNKQIGLEKARTKEVTEKISEFNKKRIREKKSFIEVLNELDWSVKFVYFAIFNYKEDRNIENFKDIIEELTDEFNNQVIKTGIKNYKIEIVLIPTFNKAIDLKNKMEEIDG